MEPLQLCLNPYNCLKHGICLNFDETVLRFTWLQSPFLLIETLCVISVPQHLFSTEPVFVFLQSLYFQPLPLFFFYRRAPCSQQQFNPGTVGKIMPVDWSDTIYQIETVICSSSRLIRWRSQHEWEIGTRSGTAGWERKWFFALYCQL